MDFCPKCGILLSIRYQKDMTTVTCRRCGYSETRKVTPTLSTDVEKETTAEPITVIDMTADQIKTLPTTAMDCPKCGYGEASWWVVQTRGADESPTQFFKCRRCGYVWREYS